MKKNLKNFLENEIGLIEVISNKTYYGLKATTKTYNCAAPMNDDQATKILDAFRLFKAEVVILDSWNLKVILPPNTNYNEWEKEALKNWNPKEPEEEPVEDEGTGYDIDNIVNNLHVGLNVTPVGVGYAHDEEDLAKMKEFVRGALTVMNVMNKIFD